MATSGIPYPPPTENLPIFNRKVFTGVEYDGRYLKIDADTNLLMNGNNITGVENLGFEDGTIQDTAFTGLEPGAISLGNVLADGDNALGQDITNLGTLNFSNGTNQITAYDNTITITETNTNAVFYPTFVDGDGASKLLYADTTTLPISVNPSTGDFNVVNTLKITQTQIAVGKSAGSISQGNNAIACGVLTGNNNQGENALALGYLSGQTFQGTNAIACGVQAGRTSQGINALACGVLAGQNLQGSNAIALGYLAGQTNQHTNSIVINGTGLALNTLGTSRFIVKPIRDFGAEVGFVALFYNPTTGELAYT
jgi:hypothetical protein